MKTVDDLATLMRRIIAKSNQDGVRVMGFHSWVEVILVTADKVS